MPGERTPGEDPARDQGKPALEFDLQKEFTEEQVDSIREEFTSCCDKNDWRGAIDLARLLRAVTSESEPFEVSDEQWRQMVTMTDELIGSCDDSSRMVTDACESIMLLASPFVKRGLRGIFQEP